LFGIKDAAGILHGPAGCFISHLQANFFSEEPSLDFYSTNLSHGDIVQGAEPRLEGIVRRLKSRNSNFLFFIISPHIQLIKEDTEGLIKKMKLKNYLIVQPPLGEELNAGKEKVMLALVDVMKSPIKKKAKSVNLLGPTYNTFNWKADVFELKRMLGNIGVSVNCVLTAGARMEDIKKAPEACLNICVYPYDCGVETAKAMQGKFKIPYLASQVAIGFENTSLWLRQIADFFRLDARRYIRQEIKDGFNLVKSALVLSFASEITVALSFENHNTYAYGISRYLKEELGMQICTISTGSRLVRSKLKDICDSILICPGIDEKKKIYEAKGPMMVLGNFYDLKLVSDIGLPNFLYADIPAHKYIFTENSPFMGYLGAKNILQLILNQVLGKLFLETKGKIEEPIAQQGVPWDVQAEKALMKISEMMPYFIRDLALKRLQKKAQDLAKERNAKVSLEVMKDVAYKYAPIKSRPGLNQIFQTAAENKKD